MLEKLREISKVFLLPLAALYFFGFICVNAYLARFGLINFDALNPRLVIAGIYPFLGLFLVGLLSFLAYKWMPLTDFFNYKTWSQRYKNCSKFFALAYTLSYIFFLLIKLGEYSAPWNQKLLIFTPLLGNFDFFGKVVEKIPFDTPAVSLDFIFKNTIYIFAYLSVVVLIIFLFTILHNWIKRWGEKKKSASVILLPSRTESSTSIVNVESETDPSEKNFNVIFYLLIYLIDAFILALFTAMAVYAYMKLRVELFDFASFETNRELSVGLIFSWLFSSTIIVYVFLSASRTESTQSYLGIINDLKKIETLPWTMQQLIIPVFATLFLFGATVFPSIPYSIGGGEPRNVKLEMVSEDLAFDSEKLFLIGESTQSLFVVAKNIETSQFRALQVNKSSVVYFESKFDLVSTTQDTPLASSTTLIASSTELHASSSESKVEIN